MAQVGAKIVGGTLKEFNANTVQDLYAQMQLSGSYTAQINGEAAELSDSLGDTDFVTFTKSVKGGNIVHKARIVRH